MPKWRGLAWTLLLLLPPLCYLAWWEAELNRRASTRNSYRHSIDHQLPHAFTRKKPTPLASPTCKPVPTNAVGVPEFSQFLLKHGGQEPKGERVRYAHMATIGLLPNKTLLAAWQASMWYEGAQDQTIYTTTSLDGERGQAWSLPMELPGRPSDSARWSPVIFSDGATGLTWLFYTQSAHRQCLRPAEGKHPELWPPGGSIHAVTVSVERPHWSPPRTLLAQEDEDFVPKVIANQPIRASSGAILLPFWREARTAPATCPTSVDTESAGVLVSLDGGSTWQARGRIRTKGTHLIEGTIAELETGCVVLMFRTSKGWAYRSESCDAGTTWADPSPTTIRNPDTKMNLLGWHAPGHTLLLAYNNHKGYNDAGCRKCRTHLTLSMSQDGGLNWKNLAIAEKAKVNFKKSHYPSLFQVGCDRVLLVFSRGYSCCAPVEAELGIQLMSYKLVST
uniref:Sialidase domain-containing protein n=1 Tax=Pyramimonas obovata TaxID=1411642 RepID=A0A7S0RQY1_9CHLO|mmetsp:Transcript_4600/g.9383  ORF Transcript_4600/g.9383 Transcript_4600/m.9383 type:complete len:449 (+) Transcript_4600:197-1543(+)|eukprot:CAMPEP_0118950284 /NCGR_PEP_ID=MMETSP1169-20130426/51105_1 /TAXON_ID=36882 /ORGANISM="Pyramimonas obovata, Strain CCMP722" /LENGTH=448 /DNA_ID=CAMNT_0006897089 /DNA_START=53 /DNA_END=1399 /DNA_ORIENTATION=+